MWEYLSCLLWTKWICWPIKNLNEKKQQKTVHFIFSLKAEEAQKHGVHRNKDWVRQGPISFEETLTKENPPLVKPEKQLKRRLKQSKQSCCDSIGTSLLYSLGCVLPRLSDRKLTVQFSPFFFHKLVPLLIVALSRHSLFLFLWNSRLIA